MQSAKSVSRFLVCAAALMLLVTAACGASLQKEEERLGREYAADVERHAKLVEDKAAVERVERIGKVLAKVACEVEVPAHYGSSEVCKFDYRFKVIEDKDVNAFSLPGGRIYVNSGLLDLVISDDELAGVLAHEIAHAAHHHLTRLIRKQTSVDKYVALIAVAGILANMRGRDLNNLLMGAQMIRTGQISSYTQQAERDADRVAVAYMVKSNYNPEGLLSFMRKLEDKHAENPTLPLGIFQTHPAPYRRVTAIAQAMQEEGIRLNMRRVRDVACAKSVPAEDGGRYRVVVSKKVLFEPASLESGASSKDRADRIAERVNEALDARVTCRDIREDSSCHLLMAKGIEIVKLEPEDALNAEAARALLDQARAALEYAVWADWLCNDCPAAQEPAIED